MQVIGIDLGTTNSAAAYVDSKGVPQIICSSEGGRTTPSVLCYGQDGEWLVGKPAVDMELVIPQNTIRSIKRLMGTHESVCTHGDTQHSPEKLSSLILAKIKADVESHLGHPVEGAVITVPAYFDSDQRQATKKAGEMAGLKVLRVINEPTAAALAYGLDKKINETVMVYDLGGGTFDVTILMISDDGVFEVKSTSGNVSLGGDDFDEAIENLILAGKVLLYPEGSERPDTDLVALEATASLRARLREAAESAKKQLTSSTSAVVSIPYFAFVNNQPYNLQASITRDQFNEAITPLVDKTKECVLQALQDAGKTFNDIDEIVLVGGSTRVPFIVDSLRNWTSKEPNKSINPDEAVAIGAAIQASILVDGSSSKIFLIDVIPLTLGLETDGGVMTPMIMRNSAIPTEKMEKFTTAIDDQDHVTIQVFQGERPLCKHNKHLGEFILPIQKAPRGVPKINVTFDVDANGILSVRAVDAATGAEQLVVINGAPKSNMEIQAMLDDAKANEAEDKAFKLITDLQAIIKEHLIQAEGLLRDSSDAFSEAQIEELKEIRESLESALNERNVEVLATLTRSTMDELKEYSQILKQKASESFENAR